MVRQDGDLKNEKKNRMNNLSFWPHSLLSGVLCPCACVVLTGSATPVSMCVWLSLCALYSQGVLCRAREPHCDLPNRRDPWLSLVQAVPEKWNGVHKNSSLPFPIPNKRRSSPAFLFPSLSLATRCV
jgi:hypothetical protein